MSTLYFDLPHTIFPAKLLLEGGKRGGASVFIRDFEGKSVFDMSGRRVLELLKEREPYLYKVRRGGGRRGEGGGGGF